MCMYEKAYIFCGMLWVAETNMYTQFAHKHINTCTHTYSDIAKL
jgi:hypothetical protein